MSATILEGTAGVPAGREVAAEVVERARAGDTVAFTEMVRHYDPRLRVLAYRLLGDAGRMDDALQEAYVKAYRALPGFRADAAPGSWLYRIVYNACLDVLRREDRHRSTSLEAAERMADAAPNPARVASERADLARALAGLPPDQRAVVLLVDADGFDYAAAAEVLGVAPGTVASRLSRARATLRRTLAPRGDTEETSHEQ